MERVTRKQKTKKETVPGTTISQTFSDSPSTYEESAQVDSASWTGTSMSMAAKEWIDTVESKYDHIVVIIGRSGFPDRATLPDAGHYREDVGMFSAGMCTYHSKVKVVDARARNDVGTVVASEIGSAPTTEKTLTVKNWCFSDKST